MILFLLFFKDGTTIREHFIPILNKSDNDAKFFLIIDKLLSLLNTPGEVVF